MPSPFPGMDPYLEDSEIWPGFHASLAEALKRQLNRQIGPKYYADVEIESVPRDVALEIANPIRPDLSVFEPLDVAPEPMRGAAVAVAIPPAPVLRPVPLAIRLRAVRVFRTKTSQLVTSIELLLPFNKRVSDGLDQYRSKRARILASRVHLVEIDLLRDGRRPGFEIDDPPLDADYILVVNRANVERLSEIWPVSLNEPLPLIPVPLIAPDPDVPLDLSVALREVYADSGYDWRINYHEPVPPPVLRPAMAEWVESLLAACAKPQAAG